MVVAEKQRRQRLIDVELLRGMDLGAELYQGSLSPTATSIAQMPTTAPLSLSSSTKT
jgi:hypothetical protein